MIISRVILYHLRMPLVSHFETSFGRIHTRDCILLEVYADGVVGFGECAADRDPGYAYETVGTAWHILSRFIIPATLGKNIRHPGDMHLLTQNIRGHRMAKAGLELALWDIFGKVEGRSLRDLLGGVRDQVEVGVSIGIQDSPQDLVKVVDSYLELGYQRVKIKIKPGRDVLDTQAVRSGFPELRLQVDANSAYSIETAEVLDPLDDMNLLLIEQPFAEDDLWDHHFLQKRYITPLCLDESILSVRHARQALEMDACRVINIKPGRVGGLSEAIAIHDLCLQKGVPVWCGGMLETGVGRAANLALASLKGFILPGDISATDRYYSKDITNESFKLNPDSTITVPSKPGLGVSIDQDIVNQFSQEQLEIT